MVVEAHRPGAFKQQNKTHKTGRHRSNSKINKDTKGRVSAKDIVGKRLKKPINKQDRRNQLIQLRKQKRASLLESKRGGVGSPPILTTILSLTTGTDVAKAIRLLKECDDESNCSTNDQSVISIASPRLKQRFTIVCPEEGDMYSNLDTAKVADRVLILMNGEGCVEQFGDEFLSCMFTQGLPSVVIAVQGLDKLSTKKQIECKQNLQKIIAKRFPDEKLQTLNTSADGLLVLRSLGLKKQRPIGFRDRRAFLASEKVSFEPNEDEPHIGTLSVTGYVRGQTLSANSLVHLPGQGDFQMSRIEYATDGNLMPSKSRHHKDEEMRETEVLEEADPEIRPCLKSEVDIDPLAGEQTWPTEEELAEAEKQAEQEKKPLTKRVPKGTSSYQAAWIIQSDDEDGEAYESEDDDEDEDDDMEGVDKALSEEESDDEEYETLSMATTAVEDADKYDTEYDPIQERKDLEERRETDARFPDEVDTPIDTPARIRFQRYRGLKSFRTSPWDPKENLPMDYSRIFQFQNFKQARMTAFNEIKNLDSGAMVGTYVTLCIKDVPCSVATQYQRKTLAVFGLLKHEHKMSVLNMCIRRHQSKSEAGEEPEIIKSKESLIYHVGYRRFRASAIFSQHTNADKHKVERFMPDSGPFVATVFAPILYNPASVLVFKQKTNGDHSLLATGSLLSVNPNRIITKRIVLSGHPFKINQRTVTVRYMFFNCDDINWFKPVELRTKWGRRGHIKQSLGTHGHMKCQFDGHLKSQDTVMLNLYKRQYPKWTFDPKVDIDFTQYEKVEEMFE